jgi:acyl-coenzyme A synthetase/AMP-(fatty) acid ligase
MLGYLDQPDVSRQVMHQGWLTTGDLAYQDGDDYYWFAGRCKDLIVLASGDNVAPAEVEQVLATHPAVAACMVKGQRQADGSELPHAFVVPSQPVTPQMLRDFLRERLSDFKVPAAIELVRELPVGLSGKVVRTARNDH